MKAKAKRNRTVNEKILDAIEKVNNIHPDLIPEIINELLLEDSINTCVIKCKKYITDKLQTPEMGRHCIDYWESRGWSKGEAYYKSKENGQKNKISPFSREFWKMKINPYTNTFYTDDEADYKRNSQRPIRKEYWMARGYSILEAQEKAKEFKNNNDNNGKKPDKEIFKAMSNNCIDYWILRGYSPEEAKKEISKRQATFSLDVCIEKFGEELGRNKWLERQEKWQTTLSNKTPEEIEEINRKKTNQMSWGNLWRNESNDIGKFYLLDLGGGCYKIGITTQTVDERYRSPKDFELIREFEYPINICFRVEQIIKKKFKEHSISKKEQIGNFGWTETFRFPDHNIILVEIEEMFNNPENTLKLFKSEFNLKYEENFI